VIEILNVIARRMTMCFLDENVSRFRGQTGF